MREPFTALLVEDDPALRDLLQRILEKRGFHVMSAPDGPSALALARLEMDRIDLVLTDVVMPGMDGFDLARELTAIHPEAKVLYLTGHAEESPAIRHQLRAAGAFLQKPFTQVALLDQVQRSLTTPSLRLVSG
jgi:CheY-like chemotaxis protein